MKVNVSKIKNFPGKVMDVKFKEHLPYLSIDRDEMKLLSPLDFSGKIENLGGRLLLTGNINVTVELLCSRCAENISLEVNAPFSEIFTNLKTVAEEEQEEEISFFSGEEIDITSHVARAILLELPMKVLCHENCKGLCSECGVNLNQAKCQCTEEVIDPRFLVLKKLVNLSSTEGGVSSGSAEKKNI